MTIREANSADTESVGHLILQSLSQHQAWDSARFGLLPDVRKAYRQWFGRLAEDPRAAVLIAETDGKVVGFLVVTVERDAPIYRITEYAQIHDLWVAEEHAEAAKTLILAAEARFAGSGITQLRATTAAANERVRKLLEASGFSVCTIDLLKQIPAARPRKSAARDLPPAKL